VVDEFSEPPEFVTAAPYLSNGSGQDNPIILGPISTSAYDHNNYVAYRNLVKSSLFFLLKERTCTERPTPLSL
jgi:hypothetical protein